MNVVETQLPGVFIIEPRVFVDQRGFFKESYHSERFSEIGIQLPFVQDNSSRSHKNVLRGLHMQRTRPQGKLVSCSHGAIYDVAVDINPLSDNFGRYVGVELTGDNHRQLWIPPGFAHGFCVLSEMADFHYKCTDFYYPGDEGGVIWNDIDIAIDWPIEQPLLSEKDQLLPTLAQININGVL